METASTYRRIITINKLDEAGIAATPIMVMGHWQRKW
jgi:hypothetical protein